MRILFLENRYATRLWLHGAQALEAEGAEISWMVQNHGFAPAGPRVHRLPYPRQRDLDDAPLPPALEAIARTDRALLHFGATPAHYRHYDAHIGRVLDAVRPDVVFGEATQFHELMTIAHCKSRGIAYLAPNATRYPTARLAFFLHDTFDAVGGEQAPPADDALRLQLDDIVHRRVIPTYMEAPRSSFGTRLALLAERLRILGNWALGERYVTPSPLKKLALDKQQRAARARWDALAAARGGAARLPDGGDWVLYPLQLQPESNLDVFGQPWIDQCATMQQAADALRASGAMLAVKPNPKSKYEMSDALVDAAAARDNIVVLPHDCPMAQVFPRAPLLLSATGTVILESIFQGKPVAVLGTHALAALPGVTPIAAPAGVADVMREVAAGTARTASPQEALGVYRGLHATSYDALLWDPLARPDLLSDTATVAKLRRAFSAVVAGLRDRVS